MNETRDEMLAILRRQEQAEKQKKFIAGIITLIFLAPFAFFFLAVIFK